MRVLVVDDSRTVGRQLAKILDDLGHDVVGYATTGTEAIRLFQETQPDLVFLDLVMPELDGISALRAMRSLNQAVTVIVVSSVGGVGANATEALRLGAKAVITKPFAPTEIANALDRAIAGA